MNQETNKNPKPEIRKCPYCGELLPPLTKVCISCGQIVDYYNDGADSTTMMSEIDNVCNKYSKTSIRIYDYILLLIPVIYLIWIIVVIVKIIKSYRIYNDFDSLYSKAQTLYGENHRFHSFLVSKKTEMDGLKRKKIIRHVIVYVILVINILMLCISLMS